ncbi:MAG: HU family DNA-binding protein [Puniceicoccales bacterium]|jgi:nucleoid DNA-binding protein|nr:HU family DNA-binding protein [Puniceicoccales bacterium]
MPQANLTKREIVTGVYEKLQGVLRAPRSRLAQKHVSKIIAQALDDIAVALSEGRCVELRNFGTFEIQVRARRVGRNPKKPKRNIVIPRRATVRFRVGQDLKRKLRTFDVSKLEGGK